MTVRVRQLIQGIETLSPSERKEPEASLRLDVGGEVGPRILDVATAKPMIAEMLQTHFELFTKLAK